MPIFFIEGVLILFSEAIKRETERGQSGIALIVRTVG
jgi:hypothetical protein